ncbi:DUF2938 domain-containing protein [Variovorax ginsengisoli]|uniref:DUF2938 domain-containing protein n=1 Tax=Variovorax ginsengisoli TaxID=363844 RepID=A0ABT8SGC0_9BURK|nr:DUF2938 domain-containing protein [Variovorax ginsengisoli]MDN8618675.1 DUF2938 domain-containing protein [Variovorax ginsengisoli]MDO1537845.1 DUF2938 domain-containing protein [Variovorax ginsengisoli]
MSLPSIGLVVLIGVIGTAVMDMWLLILSRLGVSTTDWRLVGRWVGQMAQGRFAHASIAEAAPVRGEHSLGWLMHYGVGIAYAAALVAVMGADWAGQPTILHALAFGLVTAAVPLFVMQPAMGSGFAGSNTKAPVWNCVRTIANHAVFGAGLYVAAAGIAYF